jgi:hypothetical protein
MLGTLVGLLVGVALADLHAPDPTDSAESLAREPARTEARWVDPDRAGYEAEPPADVKRLEELPRPGDVDLARAVTDGLRGDRQ